MNQPIVQRRIGHVILALARGMIGGAIGVRLSHYRGTSAPIIYCTFYCVVESIAADTWTGINICPYLCCYSYGLSAVHTLSGLFLALSWVSLLVHGQG